MYKKNKTIMTKRKLIIIRIHKMFQNINGQTSSVNQDITTDTVVRIRVNNSNIDKKQTDSNNTFNWLYYGHTIGHGVNLCKSFNYVASYFVLFSKIY